MVRKAALGSAEGWPAEAGAAGAVAGEAWQKADTGRRDTARANPAARGMAKPGLNMRACFLFDISHPTRAGDRSAIRVGRIVTVLNLLAGYTPEPESVEIDYRA